jgi:hypothetical protein
MSDVYCVFTGYDPVYILREFVFKAPGTAFEICDFIDSDEKSNITDKIHVFLSGKALIPVLKYGAFPPKNRKNQLFSGYKKNPAP